MPNVLVTGATGFIGSALCNSLRECCHVVRGVVRTMDSLTPGVSGPNYVAIGDIGSETDWSPALPGMECVIHCAARAHVLRETESDALAVYRTVNVEGTKQLAEQASVAGVKRLVFLSSIGIHGICTHGSHRFAHDDVPAPTEDYAISKWEAEQALLKISARTGLEVVIVRPPLVYGPNTKGNFLRLLQLIASGLPLPLGALRNQRSLVGLDNLIDLLAHCIDHPAAVGQTFLVSDDHDLSTSDLVRKLAHALGQSSRLLAVPLPLLRLGGRITNKVSEIERLISSLQIDISHTREVLGWTPPVSVDGGLRKTAEWYLGRR